MSDFNKFRHKETGEIIEGSMSSQDKEVTCDSCGATGMARGTIAPPGWGGVSHRSHPTGVRLCARCLDVVVRGAKLSSDFWAGKGIKPRPEGTLLDATLDCADGWMGAQIAAEEKIRQLQVEVKKVVGQREAAKSMVKQLKAEVERLRNELDGIHGHLLCAERMAFHATESENSIQAEDRIAEQANAGVETTGYLRVKPTICAQCEHRTRIGPAEMTMVPRCQAPGKPRLDFVTGEFHEKGMPLCADKNDGHCQDFKAKE